MALADGWFADRNPGTGKKLINPSGATGTVGVSGVIGLGQPGSGGSSTPPAGYVALPEPGDVIPTSGDRSDFFLVFKSAVGFDGQTALYGWSAGTDSKTFSLSAWIDYGVTNVVGWTPDARQGALYGANYFSAPLSYFTLYSLGQDSNGNISSGPTQGAILPNTFYSQDNAGLGVVPMIQFSTDSTTNKGWAHLMVSYQVWAQNQKDRCQIYLNDTAVFDGYLTSSTAGAAYNLSFSHATSGPTVEQYIGGRGGGEDNTMTDGWKGAITELWVAQGHFVNWALEANRYKFQVSDGLTAGSVLKVWAPCDIGGSGGRPFGYVPTLYLTGGSSLFPNNRASGSRLSTLTANLSPGLFDVDDPPS